MVGYNPRMRYRIDTFADLTAAAREQLALFRAHTLPSGTAVVALSGPLGSGKTAFVQTLALELGVVEPVTSPTFNIMQRYTSSDPDFPNLLHIDAYRLESARDAEPLGLHKEVRAPHTLVCIEWPAHIEEVIPDTHHQLTFTLKGGTRTLTSTPVGTPQ